MQPEPPPRPRDDPAAGRPAPSGLGAHCVGRRVVVRRLVRGETGPTGRPAMTDVLGEMLSWGRESTVIRRDVRGTGEPAQVEIPLADIVSGKPVPPRPRPRRSG